MSDYTPRPSINFTELDLPEGAYIHRLETYRQLRMPLMRWRGKYTQHLLAIVHFKNGGGEIRDITKIANKMLKRAENE